VRHPNIRSRAAWAAVILLTAASAAAQPAGNLAGKAFGVILFAQGTEVSILRGGVYITYDLRIDDIIGLPVFAGDLIGTGDDTFLEIQLHPREAVLKIAENTTFTVAGLSPEGGAELNLAYGRVRAKVLKFTGREPFRVRGRGAVAGVRGTDFGVDYIAERGGGGISPATNVYCFQGSVEVALADVTAESAGKPVVLEADEMIKIVDTAPPGDASPEAPAVLPGKTPVEPAVSAFWKQNDFQAPLVEPSRLEENFPGLPGKVDRESIRALSPEALERARKEEVRRGQEAAGESVTPPAIAPPPGPSVFSGPPVPAIPTPVLPPEAGPPAVAETEAAAAAPGRRPAAEPQPADASTAAAAAVPEVDKAGQEPAASAAETPAGPETLVGREWEAKLREMRRNKVRFGSLGFIVIGATAIVAGMAGDSGFAEETALKVSGGVLSLIGAGFFASTFMEAPAD